MLEMEGNKNDGNSTSKRFNKLLGSKNPNDLKEDEFCKTMYQKLCHLRSNDKKCDQFREGIMSRDPDLNGRITTRELQRTIEKYIDFTEAEFNLLSENLCFIDGNFKKDIDYSFLLLLLYEPINKQDTVMELGRTIMTKMLRNDDSVSLRRLIALLFRNFASDDDRKCGMITIGSGENVLKEECQNTDPKHLRKLLTAFQDSSSDCIFYPELLSFLSSCSVWNVMYRLHLVDKIRKKQGYNISDYLLKTTAKNKYKLSKEKFFDIFLKIGILMTDTALETIYQKFRVKDEEFLDTKAFVKGLNELESSDNPNDDGAPTKKDRKDISTWENNALTTDGKCQIKENLLKRYDARMLKAIDLAFDLFDQNSRNEIAALDIERVLCALGQKPSPTDIEELLSKIDPNGTDLLEYNTFMDVVLPYIRGKYEETFLPSLQKLQEAFRVFDYNKDGSVSSGEFRYILSLQSEEVSENEAEALLELLDVDGNGVVEWAEFSELYNILQDEDTILQLNVPARSALRKLQYSVLPDPEKYLSIFAGLPSNYRLSVLADLENNSKHKLGSIVCPSKYVHSNIFFNRLQTETNTNTGITLPKLFEFTIQILRITGVPTETDKRRSNIITRCARFAICTADESEFAGQWLPPTFRGNVMKLHGTVDEKKLDMWQFSNEDSTDPDKICFIRSTVSDDDHRSNNERLTYGKNLYLFMELVSTVRVDQADYQTLSNQMKMTRDQKDQELKKHLAEKRKRDEEERKLLMSKKGHIDGDIKFNKEKIKRPPKRSLASQPNKDEKNEKKKDETNKKDGKDDNFDEDDEDDNNKDNKDNNNNKDDNNNNNNKKKDTKDEKNQNETNEEENDGWDEDYITVEMSAGWVMIPIADTLSSMGNKKSMKITLDMSGGTPFSVVGIQKSDVPHRKGILEAIKRIVGIQIKSKLEFLITLSPYSNSDLLQPLPPNIILPLTGISLIGVYRHYHVQSYRQQQIQGQIDQILPQTGTLPSGDPIFSSFPRILNDPAACRVMLLLWAREMSQYNLLNLNLSVINQSNKKFSPSPNSLQSQSSSSSPSPSPSPSSSSKLMTTSNPQVSFIQYIIPEEIVNKFRIIVLKIWRALSCPGTTCPRTVLNESMKSIYRRELAIRSLIGLPLTSAVLTSTAHLKPMNSSTTKKNPSLGGEITGLGLGTGTNIQLEDISKEHIAHKPFNVRELLWGQEDI